jgi:hypothetical protein
MSQSEFRFEWSLDAANHNWAILEKYNLDVDLALQHQASTPLGFGSEFRTLELLAPITGHHPLWPRLHTWLKEGASFPLKPLAESDRVSDLNNAILRGNHKSAKQNMEAVQHLLHKEVVRGWQLPLPPDKLNLLPGAIVAPLGLAAQNTINERGEIVPKNRLIHDQTFDFSPANSVNHRVIPDSLTPCRYGTAMKRILHNITNTRRRHPKRRILITKLDVKAAYRRLHLAASNALSACVIVGFLALMGLRLLFGAAPNPSIWSDLSELMCDLCNQLARCIAWNAEDSPDLESPHQKQYVLPPVYLDDDTPLATAQPTTVAIISDDFPYTEVYLDDFITIFLDLEPMIWRGARVSLLLLHVLGRPLHTHEPIARDDLLSFEKTVAEGTPEETKVILGWLINTRTLTLSLPEDKRASWSHSITQLLTAKTVSLEDIETTIGRLNHAAYVIPTARAFLCHLRRLERHLQHRRKPAKLDPEQFEELSAWLTFLHQANKGFSINLLTFREPTVLLRADACEHGIGGYSLHSGRAWRFQLPVSLRGHLSLNLLEFIASAITIAVEIRWLGTKPEDCILSQLDSTTADFWLQRGGSQFKGVERAVHLTISCWLSTIILKANTCSYSQWIPGLENVVADSLSRDHHLNDTDLTTLLQLLAQPQMPPNFRICPLPNDITSNITSWLQRGHAPTDYRLTPKRSTLALSLAGRPSLPQSESLMTPSLTSSCPTTAHDWLAPLPTPPVQPCSVLTETLRWQHRQSGIPSQHYQRPLPLMTETTQSSTLRARLTAFYSCNLLPTATTTLQSNTNVP